MARRTETTVAKCSLTNCVWAHFWIGSHIMPRQQHSQPSSDFIGSRMYACLGVTCHLHFWQSDQGRLCATVVTGLEWTPNKSQHTKLTLAPFPTPPPPTKKKEWVTYLSLDKVCCGRAMCFTCVIYGSSVQSFILTIVTHHSWTTFSENNPSTLSLWKASVLKSFLGLYSDSFRLTLC